MSNSHSTNQFPNEPTAEEITAAAAVLKKLKPGFLPKEIFLEITRLTTTSIVEIVPLRRGSVGIEILLLPRDADDPTWPSMLHTPGTVILATDVEEGISKPLSRIATEELGMDELPKKIDFVTYAFHHSGRGAESSLVFCADLTSQNPPRGAWYPVTELPNNLVSTQTDLINDCVNYFTKTGGVVNE